MRRSAPLEDSQITFGPWNSIADAEIVSAIAANVWCRPRIGPGDFATEADQPTKIPRQWSKQRRAFDRLARTSYRHERYFEMVL